MSSSQFAATAAERFPKGLPSASVDPALLKKIGAEAAQDLVQLIRAESVNPPGNETRAAKVLIELLKREGLEPDALLAGTRVAKAQCAAGAHRAAGTAAHADRKSTRLNSSHITRSRMPSSA